MIRGGQVSRKKEQQRQHQSRGQQDENEQATGHGLISYRQVNRTPIRSVCFAALFLGLVPSIGRKTDTLEATMDRSTSKWIICRLIVCAIALVAFHSAAETPYVIAIEQWRQQREQELRADSGWLTVAGLFWLKNGLSTAGSNASCDIVLPRGPAKVGEFDFQHGHIIFRPVSGVVVSVNGKPAGEASRLKPDTEGNPDQVEVNGLTMFVIHRGDRYAIRLKDIDSKSRKQFAGLHWFPVNPSYRVTAKFVPYDPPKQIAIPNVLGETNQMPSPGYVHFTLDGHSLRLDPVLEEDHLFLIFHDETSGKETYRAGRFLDAELPKDGKVLLDFNKAYNPPCAFTPYATCPLPPKQNRLPLRIEAGEQFSGSAHH